MSEKKKLSVSLLDYGAGNVRSVRNAITSCGYSIIDITSPSQIDTADVIIFPGVGSYHSAMTVLKSTGYDIALRSYLAADRPYLGICLGMQTLFESSEEYNDEHSGCEGSNVTQLPGLGVIPGKVIKFDETQRSVPHIGWNGTIAHQNSPAMKYMKSDNGEGSEVYFVHSYYAPITETNSKWVLTRTTYEGQEYISSVQKGNVCATQFHPEKSGRTGLNFIKGFLEVRVFLVLLYIL
jgi:glutamine amidotransferase/cyclase